MNFKDNLKSTAFAIIVVVLMILVALIQGDRSTAWNDIGCVPVAAGHYLVVDADQNICVLEYSPEEGWHYPTGVDPQEIEFDISELVGWQDVG